MLRYLRGGGKHTKTIWWVLIVVTVVTFLGGFVFLLGSGLGSGSRARATGAVMTVNGESVSRDEFLTAVNEQRSNYASRYGSEPAERDLKGLETQAFRSLVMQRLYDQKARSQGLKAHDREVMLTLETSPPPMLASAPAFQTNGKFDPQKYQAAMHDPNNNWSQFEDMIRSQLPVRKLQERLFTSVKLTESELKEVYRDRTERLKVTLVAIQPDPTTPPPNVSDADLQRAYEQFKGRMASGPRRQLEVLVMPKQFGDAEVKAAHDLAVGLVNRARNGESFLTLSRQYSDAPDADRGGVVDRVLSPSDFGAELGPKVALMDTGQVTEPVRDGGRFLFFKVLERAPNPQTGAPGVRVAQIMVRVKGDDDQLRKQFEELAKLRNQAQREGLGRAAATRGAATSKTPMFDLANPPNEIAMVPEAADWAFGAKLNDVSPVLEGLDNFAVVQLTGIKPPGPPAREQVTDQLRQLAQLQAELDRLKPKADALAAALRGGQPFDKAALSVGLVAQNVDNLTRAQPDPRIAGTPELIGALFAAQPGQVVGPVRGLNGYFAAQVIERTPPDWAAFEQQRPQLAQQMLENRQRAFLESYTQDLRMHAQVKDLRAEGASY